MLHRSFALVLALMLTACAVGRLEPARQNNSPTLQMGKPEAVGVAPERLVTAVEIFRKAVEEGRVTGVQLLVARRGTVVLHEALGWRDVENRRPMGRDTPVRLASNTKSVVAAGILRLVGQGRLRLEDPVSQHLPGFSEGFSAQLTVRDLLRHTTGFGNQFANYVGEITRRSEVFPDAPSLRVEAIKIGREGPARAPSGTYHYNQWGYTVLGALIEAISGQRLDAFLYEEFYEPLGMHDTFHAFEGIDSPRVSLNYWKDRGEWEILPASSPPFARATGGLVTTAWDFAKFGQLFLNEGEHGGRRFLEPELVRQAISLQSEGPYAYAGPEALASIGIASSWWDVRDSRGLGLDIGYGYGWVISRTGAFSHAGFRGTYAYMDPEKDLMVLIFAQSRAGGTPGQAFLEAVYGALE